MKSIPKTIIGKTVRITFSGGGYQVIKKVTHIRNDEIVDEKGNSYHVNPQNIATIFEPRSSNYNLDFKEEDLYRG